VSYFRNRQAEEIEANQRSAIASHDALSASGNAPPEKRWRLLTNQKTFLDSLFEPEQLPSWLSEQDLNFLTQEFERTDFEVGWLDIATWTEIGNYALLSGEAATACLVYWESLMSL